MNALAQKYEKKQRPNSDYFGLYDSKSRTWLSVDNEVSFSEISSIGEFDGHTYYKVKKDGRFGCISDDGNCCMPFSYWDMEPAIFSRSGLLFLRRSGIINNGIGAITVDGIKILDYDNGYDSFDLSKDPDYLIGEKYGEIYKIAWADLLAPIDGVRTEWRKSKAEQERKKKEEEARVLAEKIKREELASFEAYYTNHTLPVLYEWKQKGEFEKTVDYEKRVSDETIKEMTDSLRAKSKRDYLLFFAAEHYERLPMKLGKYDADKEVFTVYTEKLGTLCLNVPIDGGEAISFKENFNTIEVQNPLYVLKGNKAFLQSLMFINTKNGKSYVYNAEKD